MSDKKQTKQIIANALVWGSLMIATSLITAGAISAEKSQLIVMLQIAGWFSTDLAVRGGGRSIKAEWACIKSFFTKSKSA